MHSRFITTAALLILVHSVAYASDRVAFRVVIFMGPVDAQIGKMLIPPTPAGTTEPAGVTTHRQMKVESSLEFSCGGDSGNVCDDISTYQSPFDTCPNLVCVPAGTDQYGVPIVECTCL